MGQIYFSSENVHVLGDSMKCEHCGTELKTLGEFCPGCGAKLSVTTKTLDTAEAAGEKTFEVWKKVGKGALRVTGKAFSKIGEAAQKAGKKKEGEK